MSLTSGYGALVQAGGATAFDSESVGTVIGRRFTVGARTGNTRTDFGVATTEVQQFAGRAGSGVVISEAGSVANADPTQGVAAGTSGDGPRNPAPGFGAHSLRVEYPNIAPGASAVVVIQWLGHSSAGASAGTRIDVDGDGVADFSARANGQPGAARLPVVAGRGGVAIDIATLGLAGVRGVGRERYSATLRVAVIEDNTPATCVFTSFGRSCGADLVGRVGANNAIGLQVSNAAPFALGYLAIGPQAAMPTPLPFGNCRLLIEPRGLGGRLFRTDAAGDAVILMRAPNMPLTVSFQALALSLDRANRTLNLDASNGTELVCR